MIKPRIEKIQCGLGASTAMLVTSRLDISYLTGIDLEGFWLVIQKDDACYISSTLLSAQLKFLDPSVKVINSINYIQTLNKLIKENGIKKILTDLSKLSLRLNGKFSKNAELKDSNLVAESRKVKDFKELQAVRASCQVASQCCEQIIKKLKIGMSEEQICFKIEEYFARRRARPSFMPIVASGPNTANPHHISSSRKLQKNDIIMLDLGCLYSGYASDLTRTHFLGKITGLQKQVFSLVRKAKEAAQKSIRDNVPSKDIDSIARKIISGGGFGSYFVHSTGHGLGLEVHEPPRLSKSDKTILKSGMCVTVEPGIYLPGKFGVRIEDTVAVTINGCEVLTK